MWNGKADDEISAARSWFGNLVRNFQSTIWFDDDLAWPVSTYFSFRLHAIRGDTLVELFHHGFEHLGANAANEHEGYESAWKNQHLVALKKLVESR